MQRDEYDPKDKKVDDGVHEFGFRMLQKSNFSDEMCCLSYKKFGSEEM